MPNEIRDITIIGGGPTGLFGAFYAGMRGCSTRIIDSLPELGGQLTALYPEKDIFDVGGFPKILAKDLSKSLVAQAMQFTPDVVLDEQVQEVVWEGAHFRLRGTSEEYLTKALVIAGGKGAFEPMRLDVPGYDTFLRKGVEYSVKDPDSYRGKRVVVVGGGDSALDWVLILKDVTERLVLVHRRDGWRAHAATVARMEAAAEAGEIEVRTFHEVRDIQGAGRVERARIFDNRSEEETCIECDGVLTFLGFKPDLGPIQHWGLDIAKNRVRVNALMETNVPGIYAAGDIVEYEGKLDLIATGFAEAAIAVNNAVHFVDPGARVNPGHSTNMKIFKDK